MNINYIINKFGNTVYLTAKGSWQSATFNAFIQPLRYKNKLYMTGDFTPIGRNTNDLYLYLGPKNHNFSDSAENYQIHDSFGNSYIIDRAEPILFKGEVLYIWAIIRKVLEAKE